MEGLHDALAWSLEQLEQGRLSVDECIARYPKYRVELKQLLQTAQDIRQAPAVSPTLDFKLNARRRMTRMIGEEAKQDVMIFERIRRTVRGRYGPTTVQRRSAMSWLLISAIVLSIFTGGGVGVAYAADGAVPGDALYGVDQGVEAIRYFFAFDPEAKAHLALEFADERLEELQELLDQGASGETIGLALEGYSLNLRMTTEAMNMVMAGEAEQSGETLRLLVQQRLMLQNQLLIQVRNQISTQSMGQVEDAIRTMQATQTRVEEMLSSGGQGGPADDAPGGPADDGQGGNPDAAPGGPAGNAPGEGQQEATQGSDATPFENENNALRACIDEVEAIVAQGSSGALGETAVRCGESIEGMLASIAAANQGDEQQAAIMAGLLNATLDEAVPLLNSLLANAPENAGTYINQVLSACEYGKQEIDRMFGNGRGQGGPGDEAQPTPKGSQGGKDS